VRLFYVEPPFGRIPHQIIKKRVKVEVGLFTHDRFATPQALSPRPNSLEPHTCPTPLTSLGRQILGGTEIGHLLCYSKQDQASEQSPSHYDYQISIAPIRAKQDHRVGL